MPARTDEYGENYADELDYILWNPVLEKYQFISLDKAIGKVIMMTEVCPYDGHVTIFVKENDETTS